MDGRGASGGLQGISIYAGVAVASSNRKLSNYILFKTGTVGSGLWDSTHCGRTDLANESTAPLVKPVTLISLHGTISGCFRCGLSAS